MADQKITELPIYTEPDDNDLLVAVDDPAGTPVTKSITMANAIKKIIPDATDSILGKASFNSTDFSVSSGAVSLKNKTSYWSCVATNFKARHPDTDQIQYNPSGNSQIRAEADGIELKAPVFLPHGAIVTAVICTGNAAAIAGEVWTLIRYNLTTGATDTQMASGSIGTEDVTISSATIDNVNFIYGFNTSSFDTNDEIFGARITYTTDYD